MIRSCLSTLCLVVTVLIPSESRVVAVSGAVPLSYFKLPAAAVGASHIFNLGGEGGGPGVTYPPADRFELSQTPAVVGGYVYDVVPNVPAGQGQVQGYYEVTIYRTVRAAMAGNAGYRDSAHGPQSRQPFAPLAISQSLNSNEWLKGRHAINGPSHLLCEAMGGVRYQNVRVDTYILDLDSGSTGAGLPCAGENAWAVRVMSALYLRLITFAPGHPPLGLAVGGPIVRIVEPFDVRGHVLLGHNPSAGGTATSISCASTSYVSSRDDAFRCMAGSEIFDPCFAPHTDGPSVVACVLDPRVRYAEVFSLSAPLPRPFRPVVVAGQGQPWAVDLATAEQCGYAGGATTSVGNLRANYECSPTGTVYGAIDRAGRQWAALVWRGLPSETPTADQLERVGVTVAYF